jgi:hypothetical protein
MRFWKEVNYRSFFQYPAAVQFKSALLKLFGEEPKRSPFLLVRYENLDRARKALNQCYQKKSNMKPKFFLMICCLGCDLRGRTINIQKINFFYK